MRDCPSCGCEHVDTIIEKYNATSLINAGISQPKLSLYKCENCGMYYVDDYDTSTNQVDQAWFDNYYLKFYETDDKPFADARLESLARCVNEYLPKDENWILDIGGKDGQLASRLDKFSVYSDLFGVGDEPKEKYDAVILSHTLEHIYDVPAMMERVKMALIPGGLLFIECPIWLDYSNLEYDNHWQHLNKFRPNDLGDILISSGFKIVLSQQIEDYREYNVWRIIGRMA